MSNTPESSTVTTDGDSDIRHAAALLKTGALQTAILNSANFSSIATAMS